MKDPSPPGCSYARIFDSLPESVIATRLDGSVVAWSRGAEDLYGFPREEALGKKLHQLLQTVCATSVQQIQQALLGPEATWQGELQKTRRDGVNINVHSRQHPILGEDGNTIVIAMDRDVAARARAVDQLRRRQEDHQFLELRERFEFATESGHIGYWFCDLPFHKQIWDARTREHFWLPRDFNLNIDMDLFYSIVHPDDRERARQAIDDSIQNHTRYDVEYRTVSPTGEIKWIHATGRTAYDSAGTAIRFDGITQDITSLKQAQAALQASQQQLTTFADTIPALAWMADAEGYIYWYNLRWYEYTGTTPEQMQGWGWQSVHDPSILHYVLERWSEAIRLGHPLEIVFPIKGEDGIFRSFLTRVTPMRNEQGKVVRWFGINTEIDELQRTRDALQLSQDRIRVALQNLPVILYTADCELRYTWMHRTPPGYPLESLIGHGDLEIEPEAFREVHAFKQSVLTSGIAARREIRITLKGQLAIYDYYAEPLRDTSGKINGLTVAALDITHTRLAEETLRKTEKLAIVGRLAASIAHEINNPLESVVSLLYVAKSTTDPEELRGYLQLAEEELYRVAHIVTHSLRFHRQSIGPSEAIVSTLLDSATTLFAGRIRNSSLQLVRKFSDIQPLLCLPNELRQVFANLIGNAFEATRAGRIELRAHPTINWRTRQPGIRVIVADTGQGVDNAISEQIFEPFITTKGEFGTGLGLWVSVEILRRHHAAMRLRSRTTPGRSGTVFSIFFPLNAEPPMPASETAAEPLPAAT